MSGSQRSKHAWLAGREVVSASVNVPSLPSISQGVYASVCVKAPSIQLVSCRFFPAWLALACAEYAVGARHSATGTRALDSRLSRASRLLAH